MVEHQVHPEMIRKIKKTTKKIKKTRKQMRVSLISLRQIKKMRSRLKRLFILKCLMTSLSRSENDQSPLQLSCHQLIQLSRSSRLLKQWDLISEEMYLLISEEISQTYRAMFQT
jgi:hypothetical protein